MTSTHIKSQRKKGATRTHTIELWFDLLAGEQERHFVINHHLLLTSSRNEFNDMRLIRKISEFLRNMSITIESFKGYCAGAVEIRQKDGREEWADSSRGAVPKPEEFIQLRY
jgi:hypothetical protein